MRNLVLVVATLLTMATAAFSQKSAVSPTASDTSKMDEQQIRRLEAEMLKGEMNSDPVVFEKILADDCLNLPVGSGLTKAKLVEGFASLRGRLLPISQAWKTCTFTCWATLQSSCT